MHVPPVAISKIKDIQNMLFRQTAKYFLKHSQCLYNHTDTVLDKGEEAWF